MSPASAFMHMLAGDSLLHNPMGGMIILIGFWNIRSVTHSTQHIVIFITPKPTNIASITHTCTLCTLCKKPPSYRPSLWDAERTDWSFSWLLYSVIIFSLFLQALASHRTYSPAVQRPGGSILASLQGISVPSIESM